MSFSTRNKKLLIELGVPIWELRQSPKENSFKSDVDIDGSIHGKTKESHHYRKQKKVVDCLILEDTQENASKTTGDSFSSVSGALLLNMLKASNLFSCNLHFANISKIDHSTIFGLSPAETEGKHSHFLFEQLELISPKVIFAMGKVASELAVNSRDPIIDLRGKVHFRRGLDIPIIVSYEPSHLIKTPLDKPKAWTDLQLVMRTLRKYS